MFKKSFAFKDILLVPQYSEVMHRSDVSVKVNINGYEFNSPIIPANMRDVVGEDMLKENVKLRNLCFLHRFISIDEQINLLLKIHDEFLETNAFNYIGASVGVKEEDKENFLKLYDIGIRIFCIDIAHGDSLQMINMIKYMKKNHKNILLVAGNVATAQGAARLWGAGADVVKIGIGSGAICSTRIQTGNGVPQLTAIMDIAEIKKDIEKQVGKKLYFISDGGCSTSGDVAKALCFADMVMAGGLFAGSIDAPGNLIMKDNKQYKEYHGSSTHKTINVEGYKGMVELKPSFKEILTEIIQALQSCCSYQGVFNLEDLKDNPNFVEITHSGIIESGAHDIKL